MEPADHKDEASLRTLGEKLLARLASVRPVRAGKEWRFWRDHLLRPASITGLLLLAAMSAMCGTGLVLVLNSESHLVQNESYSAALAALFIAVLVGYRFTKQRVTERATAAVEQALHGWRTGIANKVLQLSLRDTEEISRGRIIDGLAKHYEQLSQTVVPLVAGLESLILVCFMLVYLFSISMFAGILTVVVTGFLVLGYLNTARDVKSEMRAAAASDSRLSRLAEEVTDGFKELRLDTEKRQALQRDIEQASKAVAHHRTQTSDILNQLMTTASSASYLLAAAVIFILPIISGSGGNEIYRIITTVLFLISPIGGVVSAVQQLATAQFCVQALAQFEGEVTKLAGSERQTDKQTMSFSSIRMVEVNYSHRHGEGEAGFSVRGMNMSLERGQVVFLTGANGSGKTTALRILTGLYPVDGGWLEIDGSPLLRNHSQGYRNLFAAVFADGHVFRKPYGLDTEGLARFEDALVLLGIRQKLPEDLTLGYDPNELSTGQRKRMALALAIAEDRPVLVLDEWAADQDPSTRARFYNELLPMLKASGKTVVAVTHDERYFGLADIRYHMEEGRVQKVETA